jgi:hypothetical protein
MEGVPLLKIIVAKNTVSAKLQANPDDRQISKTHHTSCCDVLLLGNALVCNG